MDSATAPESGRRRRRAVVDLRRHSGQSKWPNAFLVAAIACSNAFAQQPSDTESRVRQLERRLDESSKLIEALTNRVHELESRLDQTPPATGASEPARNEKERLASVERAVNEIAAARSAAADAGLK